MGSVAVFVSPHGFGHAARASAVIEAMARRRPDLRFELFTTVPRWFFDDSIAAPFGRHAVAADVGLVQTSAVAEDLPATVAALRSFTEGLDGAAGAVAVRLRELGCRLVVADISPLGLAAAEAAGLPSALVENFTWDWIYSAYLDDEPRLAPFAERFAELFDGATLRVQTTPVCAPRPGAATASPVSRRPRAPRDEVRRRLGLDPDRPAVLLTMGGAGWRHPAPRSGNGCQIVLLGGADRLTRDGDLLRLPDRSPVFVPDLIGAVDAVVGKLGYSTVAEAWRAGTRYAFVPRRPFPESAVLERFVLSHLTATELDPALLGSASWLETVDDLLARPAVAGERGNVPGGDDLAADAILGLLG